MKSLCCIIIFGLLAMNVSGQKISNATETHAIIASYNLNKDKNSTSIGYQISGPFADTFSLPFSENFTTGMLQTNGWIADENYWYVAGQQGNPAPAADFPLYPVQANLNYSLTSQLMDGNSVTDCRIHLDFDLKLDVENSTGNDKLFIEVFNDTSWNLVYNFSSVGDIDWTTYELDITQFSRSKFFKIRFRAMVVDSSTVLHWMIDNIKVHKYCEPPLNLVSSYFDPLSQPCNILLEWEHPCDFQNSGVTIIDTCQVLGYNIYRDTNDDYLIGTTTESEFTVQLTDPWDMCCYYVSALFNDGESEPSNLTCQLSYDCGVGVDDIATPEIKIYPNPADNLVTVSVSVKINNFKLYDLAGRELELFMMAPSQKEMPLDISKYQPGIYIIKFLTDSGIFEKKLIIQ